MDDMFNSDGNEATLAKIDESISELKSKLAEAKEYTKMYNSDVFQKFIVKELLEDEAKKLGDSLIYKDHDIDAETMILSRLKSLRLLRNYLEGKAQAVATIKVALEREEQYRVEVAESINGELNDY